MSLRDIGLAFTSSDPSTTSTTLIFCLFEVGLQGKQSGLCGPFGYKLVFKMDTLSTSSHVTLHDSSQALLHDPLCGLSFDGAKFELPLPVPVLAKRPAVLAQSQVS